ncbi:hypothetical protein NL676_029736 [Syzygium grande]|nr:hypothetical protein NL676_029736 [Syzygium grande]
MCGVNGLNLSTEAFQRVPPKALFTTKCLLVCVLCVHLANGLLCKCFDGQEVPDFFVRTPSCNAVLEKSAPLLCLFNVLSLRIKRKAVLVVHEHQADCWMLWSSRWQEKKDNDVVGAELGAVGGGEDLNATRVLQCCNGFVQGAIASSLTQGLAIKDPRGHSSSRGEGGGDGSGTRYEAPNFRYAFPLRSVVDAILSCLYHMEDKGFEDTKPIIHALESKGISKIGAAGFCWGAKCELIQAAVLVHPAFVTPDDIKGIKVPVAVLGAEIDCMSPPELLKQFEEVLAAKSEVDGFVKIYPKTSHGWTIRYKVEDEAAAMEAHSDMIQWFVKFVKHETTSHIQ